MPMRFKKGCQDGYLTIYLSLIFGVVLSLVLTLVEGAAIAAARLQSELVADIGLDSVFAEYHRELWEQYELLFIDESYGTAKGSLDKVQAHLEDYISYNTQPQTNQTFFYYHNFLKLKSEYLKIDAVSFATDGQGEVLKAQAIDCMKDLYGVNYLAEIRNQLQKITDSSLTSMDVKKEIVDKRKEFEESLELAQEVDEETKANYKGYWYSEIEDWIDGILGKGILESVTERPHELSGVVIDKKDYVSERMFEGNVNQGCGLPSDIDSPDDLDDEIIFGEYLLQKFGSYTQPKTGGMLSYQLEYILQGRSSDVANLRETAQALIGLRSALNMLYLMTDKDKQLEAEVIATLICLLVRIDAVEALKYVLLAAWAYTEAVYDVKVLMAGGGVPLIKKDRDWHYDLEGLLEGVFDKEQDFDATEGMDYEGYLRLLLLMTNKENKVARAMDIMEMDIRLTPGNESFRIDRCIDYMKVTFGFAGSRGENFVFSKSMRYE